MKTALVSLLILIFSLPFLASFLYSAMSLCESAGCAMCGVVGHHINKWLSFFTSVLTAEVIVFVVAVFLALGLQKHSADFRPYYSFDAFDFVFLNPLKRIYAKAIVDPQIYN